MDIPNFLGEFLVGSGLLAFLSKFILSYLKTRRIKKVTNSILDVGHIYDILQEARSQLGCVRILILKTENGGGIPKVNSPIYATVLHEVYDAKIEPIKESWQRRLVDSFYCKILCQLLNEEKVEIEEKNLEGILKPIYSSYGHKLSQKYYIKVFEDMFIFCSFIFDRDEITVNDQRIINDTIHKLKQVYDRAPK